jgi:uncharacterized protein VirK/YbjX
MQTQTAIAPAAAGRDIVRFLQSIYAGTIYFARKAFSRNFGTIFLRFYKSVSDESIILLIIEHIDVIRTINSGGGRALTKRYSNYVNKYFTEYLAKGFNTKTRREILKFHHRYMMERAVESFYETILRTRSILWTETIEGSKYAISISFNEHWNSEGDISLTFVKDDFPLYEISFTVVPGTLVSGTADRAFLVGRVQGTKSQIEAIRTATKACHDIAPAYLLLEAVQAIACALKIDVIGGISDEEQLAKSDFAMEGCYFNYDTFWETFLVKKGPTNIYAIPVPFPEKPLEKIGQSHRRRTKIKRQLKQKIAESVGATFAKDFLIGGISGQ